MSRHIGGWLGATVFGGVLACGGCGGSGPETGTANAPAAMPPGFEAMKDRKTIEDMEKDPAKLKKFFATGKKSPTARKQ